MLFAPLPEDHLPDAGALYMMLHPERGAVTGERCVVRLLPAKARVDRKADDLVPRAEKPPKAHQAGQQRDRILPAREAHRDPVAVLNHLILVAGPAHKAEQFLHGFHCHNSHPRGQGPPLQFFFPAERCRKQFYCSKRPREWQGLPGGRAFRCFNFRGGIGIRRPQWSREP